jgi:hypothetical protein
VAPAQPPSGGGVGGAGGAPQITPSETALAKQYNLTFPEKVNAGETIAIGVKITAINNINQNMTVTVKDVNGTIYRTAQRTVSVIANRSLSFTESLEPPVLCSDPYGNYTIEVRFYSGEFSVYTVTGTTEVTQCSNEPSRQQ